MTSTAEATERGLYLYGVVPEGTHPPESVTGMGEGGFVLTKGSGLAVVGEWIDLHGPLGRRRHLVAHSEVLNSLAALGPVLPLQFGSVVESEEAAGEQFLDAAAPRLRELLEITRDQIQYLVKARYHQEVVLEEIVRDSPEIADLQRRTSQLPESVGLGEKVRLGELVAHALEARREGDAAWLRQQLSEVTLDAVPHTIAGMDALAEFAVCVLRGRQEEFEDHLEGLAEEMHPWSRLSLVGPMALYDFVPEH